MVVFDDFCDDFYENLKDNLKEELKKSLNFNTEESYYYYVSQDKIFGDYFIKYGYFENKPHPNVLPVKKETSNYFCYKYLKKYGDSVVAKVSSKEHYKFLRLLKKERRGLSCIS